MKKIYALLGSFVFMFPVTAQDDDATIFKADLSAGIGIHSRDKALQGRLGLIAAIEPKFEFEKKWSAGLKLEFRVDPESGGAFFPTVKGSASYFLSSDCYLSNNYSFRPFAGAGFGLLKVYGDVLKIFEGTIVGGMIRAGFEARHFRLAVDYNLAGRSSYAIKNNNYLGIKLGIVIGGGGPE